MSVSSQKNVCYFGLGRGDEVRPVEFLDNRRDLLLIGHREPRQVKLLGNDLLDLLECADAIHGLAGDDRVALVAAANIDERRHHLPPTTRPSTTSSGVPLRLTQAVE